MILEKILLGLTREPLTGYQIKKRFDRGINFFWSADQSQIYRTLKQMVASGLLRSRQLRPDRGPERCQYRLTAKGRKALREWLIDKAKIGQNRFPYVAQLYFLGELENLNVTLQYMRLLKVEMEERLHALEQDDKFESNQVASYPNDLSDASLHQYLSLQLGLRNTRSRVEWCDDCIAILEKRLSC